MVARWQKFAQSLTSTGRTVASLRIPALGILALVVVFGVVYQFFSPQPFHPWAGSGLLAYMVGLAKAAFAASLVSVGKRGYSSIAYAVLYLFVVAEIFRQREPREEFKRHLTRNVGYAMAAAIITWIPFALFSILTAAYDHQNALARIGISAAAERDEARKKITELQATLERKSYTPDFRDPAFSSMVQGIQAFMGYRRAIGADARCMILITEAPPGDGGPHIGDLTMALLQIAVLGSRCPNGNLLNIGVRPEDADAESQKGSMPGVIILHAAGDAKGVNELVDKLGNVIQVRRSYKMPKEIAEEQHVIWLQLGSGLKWNSQIR